MKTLDLARPDSPDTYSADVCIVGAGPAGITIARELIGSGQRVVLVESGGVEEEDETHALYDGDSVGHDFSLLEGRHRVFGGSGTRWAGRSAELDPIDFQHRDWIPFSGWPFGQGDLQPFYERAKAVSNFAGAWIDDDLAAAQVQGFTPAFTGGSLQRMVWRVAGPDRSLTVRTRLAPGYRRPFDYGRVYRSELERSPTVQILLHATMIGWITDAGEQRIQGITVSTLGGRTATVHADRFVLAASGIENPRLLLLAPSPLREVLDPHDRIGRFLGQHPRGNIGRVVADAQQAQRLQRTFTRFLRPPRIPVQYEVGFALTEAAQREHHLVNASAALYYSAAEGTPWDAGKHLVRSMQAGKLHPGAGRDARTLALGAPNIAANVARRYLLGRPPRHRAPSIHVELDLEQVPNPNSRIILSSRRDRFGNRLASADWRIGPLERKTARYFAGALDDELSRMGLGRFEAEAWIRDDAVPTHLDLKGNYHFIGTTRMDADPTRGVVDADCRVHGSSNLYCAGASVFPTGGHANPTLTIVALAVRLADHLRDRGART